MRSPFPGMDPFIETQKWEDFHTRFMAALGDALCDALVGSSKIRPRYVVEGDYFALVSRAQCRPEAEIYGWWLEQPMPPISIPLAGDDPDVILDLQAIFDWVYDRAGYDYSLDYQQPLKPALSDLQSDWFAQRVAAFKP